MSLTETKRVHIGGLFSGVSAPDLIDRFSKFGQVADVEIKQRKDDDGAITKTFAYMNLTTSDDKLQKCMSVYNKTKWKGGLLTLQLAKENYLDRLKEERDQAKMEEATSRLNPDIPTVLKKKSSKSSWTEPRTVHIRGRDPRKVVTITASSLQHHHTVLRDDRRASDTKLQNLTRELKTQDTEITQKQKGVFKDTRKRKPGIELSTVKSRENSSLQVAKTMKMTPNRTFTRKRRDSMSSVEMSSDSDDENSEQIEKAGYPSNRVVPRTNKQQRDGSSDSDSDYSEMKRVYSQSKSQSPSQPMTTMSHVHEKSNVETDVQNDELQRNVSDKAKKSSNVEAMDNTMNRKRTNLAARHSTKTKNNSNGSGADSDDSIPSHGIPKFKGTRSLTPVDVTLQFRNSVKLPVEKAKTSPLLTVLPMEIDLPNRTSCSEANIANDSRDSDDTDEIINKSRKKDPDIDKPPQVSILPVTSTGQKKGYFTLDEYASGLIFKSDEAVSDIREDDMEHVDERIAMATKDTKGNKIVDLRMSNSGLKIENNITNQIKPPPPAKEKQDAKSVKVTPNLVTASEKPSQSKRSSCDTTSATSDAISNAANQLIDNKVVVTILTNQSADEKHAAANLKRLESLKKRQEETKGQKTAIQKALASVDTAPTNKKIVFSSDEDSDDNDDDNEKRTIDTSDDSSDETHDMASNKPGHALFGSSDDESSDEEEDGERFRVKPQFEGTAGKELMSLQSRYRNDPRFRLDERFMEETKEEEDTEPGQETPDTSVPEEDEKAKSLRILEGIVGVKKTKKTHIFTDSSTLYFDPTKEEHKKFELEKPDVKKEKRSNKKRSAEVPKPEEAPLPEVSNEKFYTVTDSLKDAFSETKMEERSEFSLMNTFGQTEDPTSDDESEEETVIEKSSGAVDLFSKMKYDSSESDEDNDVAMETMNDKQDADTTVHEQDAVMQRPTTFFFAANDPRLKAGVSQFYRAEDLDVVREKWQQQRPELIETYRKKRKSAMRRQNMPQKKTFFKFPHTR